MSIMIMELINLIRKGRNGRTETQWLKELNYFKYVINLNLSYPNDCLAPLTQACIKNDDFTVKYLLNNGANVNYLHENHMGNALHYTLRNGTALKYNQYNQEFLSICNYLIDGGIDVNIKCKNGMNAILLTMCLNSFHLKLYLIQKLCEANADINSITYNQETPLMLAIKRPYQQHSLEVMKQSYQQHLIEVIKQLIFLGADVNMKNDIGWSPLMILLNEHRLKILNLPHNLPRKEKWEYKIKLEVQTSYIAYVLLENVVFQTEEEGIRTLMLAGRANMFDIALYILKNNYFEERVYRRFIKKFKLGILGYYKTRYRYMHYSGLNGTRCNHSCSAACA